MNRYSDQQDRARRRRLATPPVAAVFKPGDIGRLRARGLRTYWLARVSRDNERPSKLAPRRSMRRNNSGEVAACRIFAGSVWSDGGVAPEDNQGE